MNMQKSAEGIVSAEGGEGPNIKRSVMRPGFRWS